MSTDLPGYRVAPAVGRLHGPFLLRPVSDRRRDAATRAGERSVAEQAAALANRSTQVRTPAEVEAEYARVSRCDCHRWERWRCHLHQSVLTRIRR